MKKISKAIIVNSLGPLLFLLITATLISSCSKSKDKKEFTVSSFFPVSGGVSGGTKITISGSGFTSKTSVKIGDVDCTNVNLINSESLTCITGSKSPFGGAKDIFVKNGSSSINLSGGFEYLCPWIHNGVANCGAVPPESAPALTDSFSISTFQSGHGFSANAGGSHNYNNTSDFVIGTQSASITSSGTGGAKTLKETSIGPFDFTGRMPRIHIKIDNVDKLTAAQLYLGDSNLSNHYKFNFQSTQGQQWTTEGDWVTFTMPFTGGHVGISGSPDRSAITDIQLRIVDDTTGAVTLYVNEIAAVDEQTTYASGIASITFDDGFISQYSTAKPLMDAKGYKATAYIIKERIDTTADYLSLTQLKDMSSSGWEIAAHAFSQATHSNGYPGFGPL